MKIGNRVFDTASGFYIMGIVNLTPDSFSDGGKYNRIDKALAHIEEMIRDGADILDIGGESTRPNCQKVSAGEEIERVLPVLELVRRHFDIPVSLDTYKSEVALACAPYIDMVNDIRELQYDADMARVIAGNHLACCIMHHREKADYRDYFDDLKNDLGKSIEAAKQAGIAEDRIMIDAGVGFAKTYEQNLIAINRTDALKAFHLPILMATSNKSVIGLSTGADVTGRVHGTVATTVIGALKGASFFRVHDVKANRQALDMTKAVLNERKDG